MNWSEIFYYDETSPSCLRWKENRYAGRHHTILVAKKDDPVGWLDTSHNYYKVSLLNKRYYVHRIIWQILNGEIEEGLEIDHIDGNSSNNILSNLRKVTRQVNCRNFKKNKSNSSGVTGVSYDKTRKRWESCYYDENCIRHRKSFSESAHGENAFKLACEWRNNAMKTMSTYSERHGET